MQGSSIVKAASEVAAIDTGLLGYGAEGFDDIGLSDAKMTGQHHWLSMLGSSDSRLPQYNKH